MRRRDVLSAAGLAIPSVLMNRLDDALTTGPSPARLLSPPEMASRLAQARVRFDNGDVVGLLDDLPDLLGVFHAEAEREGTPTAHARLAGCYDLATAVLNKVGRHGSSHLTADRSRIYAAMSGSPIAMAASARGLSIVLRHDNRRSVADRVISKAAEELEATGLATPAQTTAYTQMLCTCAYNASQIGDRERALELITEAEALARGLPDSAVPGQPFTVTPAQVSLYRVGIHWSLGDAGAALHVGHGLRAGMFATPERRGRLHTDLARAWWMWGKPEETAEQLLAAHRQAPSEVRSRPSIRKIVEALAREHPRTAGVRRLVAIVGGNRTA